MAMGQGRALGGVSARAQLVEEHQRCRGPPRSRIPTMLVMWLEKVDRLCSMLCSSPMSANTCWNTASSVLQLRAGPCKPALGHEGKQAHGFQGHRLAAGVGAGDNQRGELPAHPQIGGHHHRPVNEGMPAADDVDKAAPGSAWG